MMARKKTLHWLILGATICVIFESAALATLLLLRKWKGISYAPTNLALSQKTKDRIGRFMEQGGGITEFDPFLGWIPKPSKTILYDTLSSQFTITTINTQRMRGRETYSVRPKQGVTRICAFGDSYTFGAAVSDKECWPERLSAMDAQIEVMNFGVGGYGLDQALLRYEREGVGFYPHVVLICYLTENIARHVNVYRPFYSKSDAEPLSKPRFIIEADTLKLLKNPLSTPVQYEELVRNEGEVLTRLGRYDYFYQRTYQPSRLDFFASMRLLKVLRHEVWMRYEEEAPYRGGYYNIDSESFQVTTRIIDRFCERVLKNRTKPVVLILPHEKDIERYRRSRTKSYRPLIDYLRHREVRHVDVIEAFEKGDRIVRLGDLFNRWPNGHYSPLANELVAKYVFKYLRMQDLLSHR